MWSWVKQALFADDLFLRVIFVALGTAVTIGIAFIVASLLTDPRPYSIGFALVAVFFLGAVFLGLGLLPLAAAFSAQETRAWRWTTKLGDGISSLDELAIFLAIVAIALFPLVLVTLFLHAIGVRGQAWKP